MVRPRVVFVAILSLCSLVVGAETSPLRLPASACKNGTATAAMPLIAGASYDWTVDGGTIVAGAGTERVSIRFDGGDSAHVSVTVRNGILSNTSSGTIPLRAPLAIHDFSAVATSSLAPVTIAWSYDAGAEPQTQYLTGTDFAMPVIIPRGLHSYSYTPSSDGAKDIQLHAVDAMTSAPVIVPGRRRAASSTDIVASECNAASAVSHYSVARCGSPSPRISAPQSVSPGTAFVATVSIDPGANADWTFTNATPAHATGNAVSVVAGSSGDVGIDVKVTNGAGCASSARESIRIEQQHECDRPTAVVSQGAVTCGGGTARVVFTGTFPFTGTWSDGEPFTNNSGIMTRTLTKAGTFTIASFSDLYCAGTATGSAIGGDGGPSVKIEQAYSCDPNVVAHFTGTPPYSGVWNDTNLPFTTSDKQMSHVIVGDHAQVYSFHDALCDSGDQWTASNLVMVKQQPTGTVTATGVNWTSMCRDDWSPGIAIAVNVDGWPPFNIEWDDGTVQKDQTTWPVIRYVNLTQSKTFRVVKVTAGDCPVQMKNDSIHYDLHQRPWVTPADWYPCAGQISTATAGVLPDANNVSGPPPADAAITWSIKGGTIVSGQGTRVVTWKVDNDGVTPEITATYSFGDSCPTTYTSKLMSARALPGLPVIKTMPATFKAGQRTRFVLTKDTNDIRMWLETSNPNDRVDIVADNGDDLTFEYQSAGGTGPVSLKLTHTDHCETSRVVPDFLSINIVP